MNIFRLLMVFLATATLSHNAVALEVLQVAERQPGNFESWVALIIIFSSVFTAWFLNHNAPKVRVFGTLLAASGCFALAAWFVFFVLGTGFLENPKPNQTPLDSAKPALLWAQAMTSLIVGVILIGVAFKQSKSTEVLKLEANNEANRYGLVSRILHWTIAILFLALIPMGIFASIIPEATPYRIEYYVVHKTIGVIVLALVLIRLFWNRKSKRPELDSSLKPKERKLAHAAHIALYVMMVAIPLTGFIMTSFHGAPTFFFAWQLEPLWGFSKMGTIAWGMLHKYLLPYLLYIILGAHILGALKHQLVDKHKEALKRMVS
ncbi:MAG: cytochrome b561 [Arenicella sp.]|jgi:cytochrome b561